MTIAPLLRQPGMSVLLYTLVPRVCVLVKMMMVTTM